MKQTLKRFWPYMKGYPKHFVLAIFGTIMVAGGTAAIPYVIQPVMDKLFIEKNEALLYSVPFLILAAYLLKGVGTYVQAYYTSFIGEDIIRRIRNELLSTLSRLDLGFFQDSQKGKLISRITNDTTRIQHIVSKSVPDLIRDFLTIFALLGVATYQNPQLAFLGIIVIPVAAYPLSKLAKKMKKHSKVSQVKIGEMTSLLSEIFHNIEVVKGYNAEEFEQKRFEHSNGEFFKYTMKTVRTNQLTSPLMESIGGLGSAIVVLVGGAQVINGNMTTGEFFSFMAALFMLYAPVKNVSRLYNSMQDAVAAGERIFEFLHLKPTIQSGSKRLDLISSVELDNIVVSYGNKKALDGVSLCVNSGDKIALIGSSGGGKSTFVNLLPRFVDFASGALKINGVDIREFDIASVRDQIGFVSQQTFLFRGSVAENVAYGKEIDEAKVIEALKKANAWEFVELLNGGIHAEIGEGGAGLSGGQKQRLSIARALYKNPSMFILDEATSALDNESERKVQEALDEITKGKITFVVAHRLSTIKHMDTILLLLKGKIICKGTENEMYEHCKEYKKLKRSEIK